MNRVGRLSTLILLAAALAAPSAHAAFPGLNGKLILDVDKEAVVTYLLEPGLFPEKGLHTISVVYLNPGARMEAVSEPFLVEVDGIVARAQLGGPKEVPVRGQFGDEYVAPPLTG